jgi:hypothetical protein
VKSGKSHFLKIKKNTEKTGAIQKNLHMQVSMREIILCKQYLRQKKSMKTEG